jgi:hypothetical protein
METAIETLEASGRSAVRYTEHGATDEGWAYYEGGTRAWYAVSDAGVADLDARLAAGEVDAYSRWCAATAATDLADDMTIRYVLRHGATHERCAHRVASRMLAAASDPADVTPDAIDRGVDEEIEEAQS